MRTSQNSSSKHFVNKGNKRKGRGDDAPGPSLKL
jgi:hypothetical protein